MPGLLNVLAPAYVPDLPSQERNAASRIRHLMRTSNPVAVDSYREDEMRKLIENISACYWEPMFDTPLIVHDHFAPNINVFEVFTDGTVTSQKGSWAYGHRSVFDAVTGHPSHMCKALRFRNECRDGTTFMRTYDYDLAKAMGKHILKTMQQGQVEVVDKRKTDDM